MGWTTNRSDNGIVVTGNFYQSKIHYDPPTQNAWRSAPDTKGWASYKVSANVREHEAWGLGIYSVFLKPDVELSRAIETPDTAGVRFHHTLTTALSRLGAIDHVINDTGERAHTDPQRNTPKVDEYPANR